MHLYQYYMCARVDQLLCMHVLSVSPLSAIPSTFHPSVALSTLHPIVSSESSAWRHPFLALWRSAAWPFIYFIHTQSTSIGRELAP